MLVMPHGSRHPHAPAHRPRRQGVRTWLARWSAALRPAALTSSGRRTALFVAALMAGTLCLGDRGLVKLVSLLRDRAALRRELVTLETRRTSLEAELRLYTSDSATIERTARETLDWVRHGEVVYKFPSK